MPSAEILNLIADGGSFTLCVVLVLYVMQQNSKREERLMVIMDKYADKIAQMAQALELIESKIPMGMGIGRAKL